MVYIDFTTLPPYEKKLPQVLDYEDYKKSLSNYFKKHKKYNQYSLCLWLKMSNKRFVNNYLHSKDDQIKELTEMAINVISAEALNNADEYKSSLRYIMARQNTGKDFIELDSSVQEANKSNIIILPGKNKE